MFNEEVRTEYDPLISGLEPESFDTVFQEIFSGIKNYLNDDEPPVSEKPSDFLKLRLDENIPYLDPNFMPVPPYPDLSPAVLQPPLPVIEKPTEPRTRTRQYAMLRCSCSQDFVSQFALEYHETKCHQHYFNWFCSECNIRYDTLQQASDHSMMTHSDGQMPLLGDDFTRRPPGPYMMQALARRSTDFVKEFLYSRGKKTVMTASYYMLAKCELQAISPMNVGLVIYNQAKTDLLTTIDSAEHEDFISYLKSMFIYGKFIKRVPLDHYYGPTTVYKTLTFTSIPSKSKQQSEQPPAGRYVGAGTMRIAGTRPQYTVNPKYRVTQYSNNQYRTMFHLPTTPRSNNYALIPTRPASTAVRRLTAPPSYTLYPVRSNAK
ncbi:hypothetical protein GCK72_024030 [Caenorhabditis remanei]|nr:hypothetical protein GCK72_024030 [Caenorhabditis remanei]KAF1747565.1 hypothetical protein GCK72_024030 [Caenorhabditis remanei]